MKAITGSARSAHVCDIGSGGQVGHWFEGTAAPVLPLPLLCASFRLRARHPEPSTGCASTQWRRPY